MPNFCLKKLTLVTIISCIFTSNYAAEYFVSLSGSDKNNGTIERPFATIFKASEMAQPSDTITIRGGTYELTKLFSPIRSGLAHKWIIYRSMPGEVAVFDGKNIFYENRDNEKFPISGMTKGIFQIEDVNYIRFENIKVINSRAAGFIVRDSKKVDLIGCETDRTYNSGVGIWYSDSVNVYHCEVVRANDSDYRNVEVPKPHEAPHEAISICGARYFDVAYNHVHNCHKEGIDCKEISRHGIIQNNLVHDLPRQAYYVDAWFGLLEDVELFNNVAYNCFTGFAVSVEGKNSELRNVRFHHNILYNMKASGILFGAWGGDGPRSDIHIYNNTVYNCGSPNLWIGGVGSFTSLSKNFNDVYIYRNIFDKGWDYEMGFVFTPEETEQALTNRNFVAAENLIESAKNRPSRLGQYDLMVTEFLPENNVFGAPLYKNELSFDFTPEIIPAVKKSGIEWKYVPSEWYGALKPEKLND